MLISPCHTPLRPAVSRLAEKRARLTPAGVVLLCERRLPAGTRPDSAGCDGDYHELRRRRRLPAGTRPDSAGCDGDYHELRRKLPRTAPETTPGCAGSYHELHRRRRQPAKGYHEIVMAFRLPSAARPVSTPTTDKTTVPSAAGTTSSNTARYLSRPVPVHSFMP